MEREISCFNERLMIQKNSVTVDRYGNHLNDWTDYFACFTYVSTYQHDRENEAATTTEERSINFEVRYCTELMSLDSIHYRVVFRGAFYDIQTVDFMNYQKKTLRIVCKLAGKEKRHEQKNQD